VTLLKVLLGSCLLFSCGGKAATSTTQPAPERKVVTETKIEILGPVSFDEAATLSASSTDILEAIASTLEGNPDIELVAVQAAAADQELSEQRGQVIIDFLVAKDVSTDRLTNQPTVSEEQSVEFEILRRSSEEEP
jgi:outer membrane protein OmpA-like peptidoglycan-associated protein